MEMGKETNNRASETIDQISVLYFIIAIVNIIKIMFSFFKYFDII